MVPRQPLQQRTDQHQIRKLHQLGVQLALLVIAFNGAAEMHATFVLLLAAGTRIEIDAGYTVLGHAGLPERYWEFQHHRGG